MSGVATMRRIELPATPLTGVDPGPAPMQQWLNIADLVIDDSYQRDLKRGNRGAIRRIAEQFKWSRFSPVFVAPVEGGKYAIIDGQHRTHAAALCGFDSVPCQIVQMTREEQAASFAAVNGLVTKVTAWNILRAAMVAGEDWAVECSRICAAADCTLMTRNGTSSEKQPGEIYAVQLIKKHVTAGDARAVTLTLSGLRRSEFGSTSEAWGNDVLKPVLMAVCDRPWLVKAGVDLAGFFDAFDIWDAQDKAIDFIKAKRRQGVTDISRFDIVASRIGDRLDVAFPQRIGGAP